MSDNYEPDKHPFGETEYRHYNPDEIETVEDAVECLEWIASENAEQGFITESACFQEAADLLKDSLSE